MTEEEALECARYFLSKKEQFIQACKDFDLLRDKSSDSVQEFLSEFFNMLEDEEQVLRSFVTRRSRVKQN